MGCPWKEGRIFLLKPSLSVVAAYLLDMMKKDGSMMDLMFDFLRYEHDIDRDYFDDLIHEIGINSETVRHFAAPAKAAAKQDTIDQLAICAFSAYESCILHKKYLELKPSKKALDEIGMHASRRGVVRSKRDYATLLGMKPKEKHCELMIAYAIRNPYHGNINGDTRKEYGRKFTVDEYFLAVQNCLARDDLLEAVRISNADRCPRGFLEDLHERCLATGDFSLAGDSVRLLERELSDADIEKLTQAS